MPRSDAELRLQQDPVRAGRQTSERQAQGRCPRCGKRASAVVRGLCEPSPTSVVMRREAGIQRIRDLQAQMAWYPRARELLRYRLVPGLCARCGGPAHDPDRRLCAACGEREVTDRPNCVWRKWMKYDLLGCPCAFTVYRLESMLGWTT